MAAHATYQDYAERYGPAQGAEGRVGALLEDASALVDSMLAGAGAPAALLRSTVCAMVSRAMAADGLQGVGQCTQSAGDYSASLRFANPNGDLYLTQTERDALGVGRGLVGTCDLCGGGAGA